MSGMSSVAAILAGQYGNTGQPRLMLRVGQFVSGTVNRHLGKNQVMTTIQGKPIIASSQISVNVGEQLLMQVKSVRPKPRLKVVQQIKSEKRSSAGEKKLKTVLETFQRYNLPVTPAVYSALLGERQRHGGFSRLLDSFEAAPDIWRRLLWNASLPGKPALSAVVEWIEQTQIVFSPEWIRNHFHEFFSGYQIQSFNEMIQAVHSLYNSNLSAGENTSGGMSQYLHLWEQLLSIGWDTGYWIGGLLPFAYGEYSGLAGFGLWNPDRSDGRNTPTQLTLLGVLTDGRCFHVVLEFREDELAGVIDCNSQSLQQAFEENLPVFRTALQSEGFRTVHVRCNYIYNFSIDPAIIFPANNSQQTITV
ncbi:MAG: hypothetical protein K9N46_07280 [Candidatus Marinimicrobia bacterium]|nr:hypothetical protein [Candidatus Neomarinimicrobiota bacterium]MCF7880524.1 hypothetical protein [Candidatus Neomarinimicrobiota bacterium]